MFDCLAPVVLIGQLITIQPNQYHTSNPSGTLFEIQSCERGLGVNAKASPEPELYGAGVQYGLEVYDKGDWSSTVLVKGGMSHSGIAYRELPMQTQFETGVQVLVGYEQLRFGVEWWHMSNAGLQQPNIGLDMLVFQSGWGF